MTKFIAVSNRRGGVGKTTVTMMLAGFRTAQFQNVDIDVGVERSLTARLDVSPLSGDEIAEIVNRITRTPPTVIARYNAILHAK